MSEVHRVHTGIPDSQIVTEHGIWCSLNCKVHVRDELEVLH